MPLSFMDVLVHFCCHKVPICHNAEQQKQYDESSLAVLKNVLKTISVPLVRTVSLLLLFCDNEWRNKSSWKTFERRSTVLCLQWNNQTVLSNIGNEGWRELKDHWRGRDQKTQTLNHSLPSLIRDWAFPGSKYRDYAPPSIILYTEKYKENTLLEFCSPNRYSSHWGVKWMWEGDRGNFFFYLF